RLVESLLERVELAAAPGERFDGADRTSARLDGEQQARADRLAVELDRARAADAVLAADVRAGQPGLVADGVGEEEARRHRTAVLGAVDLDGDLSHAAAFSTARRTSASIRRRR